MNLKIQAVAIQDLISSSATLRSRERKAWVQWHIRDGWIELAALTDMANVHMSVARQMAETAQGEPDGISRPLSAVILAACALEAFINQVAFFVHETGLREGGSMEELAKRAIGNDLVEFQRRTEITVKWDLLGASLCGTGWPPPQPLWMEFRNVIYIRNELVHFKAVEYEQIIPPPPVPLDIYRRLPPSVKPRDIREAWPTRVLTPDLANWGVRVADALIRYFKDAFRHRER